MHSRVPCFFLGGVGFRVWVWLIRMEVQALDLEAKLHPFLVACKSLACVPASPQDQVRILT